MLNDSRAARLVPVLATALGLVLLHATREVRAAEGQAPPLLLQKPTASRTHVVFSYAGDLWTVERAGGEARRLTSGAGVETDPFFSPDGSQLVAFTGEYDGNVDVYVVPAGRRRPAAAHLASRRPTRRPGWTPDGKARPLPLAALELPLLHAGCSRCRSTGGLPAELPLAARRPGRLLRRRQAARVRARQPVAACLEAVPRRTDDAHLDRGPGDSSVEASRGRTRTTPRRCGWAAASTSSPTATARSGCSPTTPGTKEVIGSSRTRGSTSSRYRGPRRAGLRAVRRALPLRPRDRALHLRVRPRLRATSPQVRPRFVKVDKKLGSAALSPSGQARGVRGPRRDPHRARREGRHPQPDPHAGRGRPRPGLVAGRQDGSRSSPTSPASTRCTSATRAACGEVKKIELGDAAVVLLLAPLVAGRQEDRLRRQAAEPLVRGLWTSGRRSRWTPDPCDDRPARRPAWSPDSKWLAYTKQLPNQFDRGLRVLAGDRQGAPR